MKKHACFFTFPGLLVSLVQFPLKKCPILSSSSSCGRAWAEIGDGGEQADQVLPQASLHLLFSSPLKMSSFLLLCPVAGPEQRLVMVESKLIKCRLRPACIFVQFPLKNVLSFLPLHPVAESEWRLVMVESKPIKCRLRPACIFDSIPLKKCPLISSSLSCGRAWEETGDGREQADQVPHESDHRRGDHALHLQAPGRHSELHRLWSEHVGWRLLPMRGHAWQGGAAQVQPQPGHVLR